MAVQAEKRLNKLLEHLRSPSDHSISPMNCHSDEKNTDPLLLRELEIDDFDKGFVQLLSQLTTIGNVTREMFTLRFNERKKTGLYYTAVIEDTSKRLIIATPTLLFERKFIHSCGLIGHIEDVVVSRDYRSKNLGIRVMDALKQVGAKTGCYKLILDCSVANTSFYSRLGFVEKERQMALYFPENDRLK